MEPSPYFSVVESSRSPGVLEVDHRLCWTSRDVLGVTTKQPRGFDLLCPVRRRYQELFDRKTYIGDRARLED